MKEKTVLSLVRGPEPTKMINVRIPISLHAKAFSQIIREREAGNRNAGWTEIVNKAIAKYVEKPVKPKKK